MGSGSCIESQVAEGRGFRRFVAASGAAGHIAMAPLSEGWPYRIGGPTGQAAPPDRRHRRSVGRGAEGRWAHHDGAPTGGRGMTLVVDCACVPLLMGSRRGGAKMREQQHLQGKGREESLQLIQGVPVLVFSGG
jgi:hypothetical protein